MPLYLWFLGSYEIEGITFCCFQSGYGNLPSVVSVRDRDVTEECDRARLRDNVTWVFVTGSHDKWAATKTNCQSVKLYCVATEEPGITTRTQSANDIRDLSRYFKYP